MMRVICPLCRFGFEVEPGVTGVRCPRCEGRIPASRLPGPPSDGSSPAREESPSSLACAVCLHLTHGAQGTTRPCPYCGEVTPFEQAAALARRAGRLDLEIAGRLLAGDPPERIQVELEAEGLPGGPLGRRIDRQRQELPFLRHPASQGSSPEAARPEAGRRPPTTCDACREAPPSGAFEASWEPDPEELKRYRQGWGGFEGDFRRKEAYLRQALYHLCLPCSKRARRPDFARGYPYDLGFRLVRLTPHPGSPR